MLNLETTRSEWSASLSNHFITWESASEDAYRRHELFTGTRARNKDFTQQQFRVLRLGKD
jgi:hypothetical protein